MKRLLPALVLVAACGPPTSGEIGDLTDGEQRPLCRHLSDHERSCLEGRVTFSVEMGECLSDSIPLWERCGLSVDDVRGCVDALDSCSGESYVQQRQGEWLESECGALLKCQLS